MNTRSCDDQIDSRKLLIKQVNVWLRSFKFSEYFAIKTSFAEALIGVNNLQINTPKGMDNLNITWQKIKNIMK